MGCGGSKAAPKVEKDPDDKFMDEVEMDEIKVTDFDEAFAKGKAPLSSVVDLNNALMGCIDQIVSAAAALFGAFVAEAVVTNGEVTFEVNKPPEKEGDKKVVIVTVQGPKDAKSKDPKEGIKIVDKPLYDGAVGKKTGPRLVEALEKANGLLGKLNTALAASKEMAIEIKANRVVATTKEAPTEKAAAAKFSSAMVAIGDFNAGYFSVKSSLAKAAFEDGLNMQKIIQDIFDKLKAAMGETLPIVNVDMAGLAEGKLNFDIVLPGDPPPKINEFIDANALIPPMLKKAWGHINGEGGLIETLKAAAAMVMELKPQIEDAAKALQDLPTDPQEIMGKAKEAGLKPMEVMGVPKKIVKNTQALASTPVILKAFVNNLKSTCEDLAAGLTSTATDSKVGKETQV